MEFLETVSTNRTFSAFSSDVIIGRVSLNYNPSSYIFYEHMDGEINEVAYGIEALNQSEIQNYMSCPPTGNEVWFSWLLEFQ